MTEDAQEPREADDGARGAEDEATRRSTREKMGDGIRQGIGVLSAFRDALEETIQEARERGDLSTERAREVMKEALDRAQAAGEKARDRLDFASHSDMDAARAALEALRARVARLEEHVFGAPSEGGATGPADAADGTRTAPGKRAQPGTRTETGTPPAPDA